MQIVCILLSLAILTFLCFKRVPIFFASLIAGTFLLVTAGINPVTSLTTDYVKGLTGYIGSFYFIFILGSLFGKITDISGAADSIANGIINKLGEKAIIPALLLTCGVMAYGGISVFVCLFTVYPMMIALFKKGDYPRELVPVVYLSGAGTFACMLPGSPQVQNLIPAQTLGVAPTAALVPGIIAGIFEIVAVFVFVMWYAEHSKKKGMHFRMTAKDEAMLAAKKDKPIPNFLLSIAPMVILLVVLNVFKWSAELSLFTGCVAGLICYYKYIDWKKVWLNLGDGVKDGSISLLNTASVVAFGSLIKVVPAFNDIVAAVTQIGGNPIISSTLMVTILSGVCASGSGGLGIALPIIVEHFTEAVNLEALARVSTISCLILDSLPHNGLIVTTLNVSENDLKTTYFPVFITTVVTPLIATVLVIALFFVFGMA